MNYSSSSVTQIHQKHAEALAVQGTIALLQNQKETFISDFERENAQYKDIEKLQLFFSVSVEGILRALEKSLQPFLVLIQVEILQIINTDKDLQQAFDSEQNLEIFINTALKTDPTSKELLKIYSFVHESFVSETNTNHHLIKTEKEGCEFLANISEHNIEQSVTLNINFSKVLQAFWHILKDKSEQEDAKAERLAKGMVKLVQNLGKKQEKITETDDLDEVTQEMKKYNQNTSGLLLAIADMVKAIMNAKFKNDLANVLNQFVINTYQNLRICEKVAQNTSKKQSLMPIITKTIASLRQTFMILENFGSN